MVPIGGGGCGGGGGGSTKYVLRDRWIVYTKSRKELLHERTFYMTQAVCLVCFFKTIIFLSSVSCFRRQNI